MRAYLHQVLIALDQLGTALLGGYADETLSSYAWRLERDGKPFGKVTRPVIDFLFSWQSRSHCRIAYELERVRAQCPPEMRTTKTERQA
jgi:hypothetical protein